MIFIFKRRCTYCVFSYPIPAQATSLFILRTTFERRLGRYSKSSDTPGLVDSDEAPNIRSKQIVIRMRRILQWLPASRSRIMGSLSPNSHPG